MIEKLTKLILGDLGEKRAYRQMMKRAAALPRPYRKTFHKIQHYVYTVGYPTDFLGLFNGLLDLFEESVIEGLEITQVTGPEVSQFCDALLEANRSGGETRREQLNREIAEHFKKERFNHA